MTGQIGKNKFRTVKIFLIYFFDDVRLNIYNGLKKSNVFAEVNN